MDRDELGDLLGLSRKSNPVNDACHRRVTLHAKRTPRHNLLISAFSRTNESRVWEALWKSYNREEELRCLCVLCVYIVPGAPH